MFISRILVPKRMSCLKEHPLVVVCHPIHNGCLVEIHVVVEFACMLCHFCITVSKTNCPFVFFYPSLQGPVGLSVINKIAITANNLVDDPSGLCR